MKEHDWDSLYASAYKFMKTIRCTDFQIETNVRYEMRGEPFVMVHFPKRNNPIEMLKMETNEYCSREKGFKRNRKLYVRYKLRINKLNV